MLRLLPKLAPVVVRHLAAYIDLAAADASQAAAAFKRRLISAVIGAVASVFALMAGSAWLIAAAWDTPWRHAAFGLLLFVFAATAVLGLMRGAGKQMGAQQPFARLKAEWEQDQKLIHELTANDSEPATHGR